MKHSREWELGDTAQRRWADRRARQGHAVLPTYAFEDVVPETKAPVLLTPDGKRPTPDTLVFGPPRWEEVKAKSIPTWRRFPPGPRWEHGIDWGIAAEYLEVEKVTGVPVLLVVFEVATPPDLGAPCSPSEMLCLKRWRGIRLTEALGIGQHRRDWPGGDKQPWRRGRGGRGGLLWPLSAMVTFRDPGEVVPANGHLGQLSLLDTLER